jgi:beta-lactamase class A
MHLAPKHTGRIVALLAASLWVGLAPAQSATHGARRHPHVAAVPGSPQPDPTFWGMTSEGDTALVDLGREIQRIAAPLNGAVGVAIVHLESNRGVSLRGGERFPMASVYKLPIAIELLHQVACDQMSFDDVVPITSNDLRSGSGWIRHHRSRTAALTVLQLLEAMLQDSDNTASDLLLRMCGGPAVVTERLRTIGIEDVRVDRLEANMSLDYSGVEDVPPDSTWTLAELARVKGAVPVARRDESARAFLDDPRDTATPDAMAQLLALVWRGGALGPDESSRLLEILERTRTGPGRLRGKLPPDTPVAHKTGTWSTTNGITAAVNDVGIVTLPGDAGHLAMVVFVKGSNRSPRHIERGIASIARAAYDHWCGRTVPVERLAAP